MKLVNKELGLLVEMPEKQARICLKRNPTKYALPESVEEIELEEDEIEVPKTKSKPQSEPQSNHITTTQAEPQAITYTVVKDDDEDEDEQTEPQAEINDVQSIEDVNAGLDATKGAIALANKEGINLHDLGISGRIMKTDVENYLSSK